MSQANYSALDRPEILAFIFYPRKDHSEAPSGASDHFILVDEGVSIVCRFYVHSRDAPSVLFFHGNGEVVSDYDSIAPMYNRMGLNLFVADYRGYGASQGQPTLGNTVSDASVIFRAFEDIVHRAYDRHDIFVMGRSLGSMSAIEIANRYPAGVTGLIIESGFASFASFASLVLHLGFPVISPGMEDLEFPNLAKIRAVGVPTLIVHGGNDQIIPPTEGEALFRGSAAEDKRLVIIPGAGHNDILWTGMDAYLRAITEFTSAYIRNGEEGTENADC